MALKTTPISKLAQLPVAILLLLALFSLLFWLLLPSVVLALLALLLIFVYRDPIRQVPSSPLAIISPIDGRVMAIEMEIDLLLQRESIVVSIKMPRFGPFIVRCPTEGKVMQQIYDRSKNIYSQWVQTDELDDVVLRMKASSFGGGLRYRVSAGERIGQGAHCTILRFGHEVKLSLPANSQLKVKKGDTILAGEDILALLVH